MDTIKSLQNYKKYLEYISKKLDKFFEQEKPYICCKMGCGRCCKNASLPYTFIEMFHMLEGFEKLSEDKKAIVRANVKKIIVNKKDKSDINFQYDCPFLIDNVCSVYEYRGIICRAFGLIAFDSDNPKVRNMPFCCYEGLNYSCVYDEKIDRLSEEKVKALGYNEPKAYNVKYPYLISEKFAKIFDFEFGEVKPLIDWFWDFDL